MWFSPDSNKIAFMHFNDFDVEVFKYELYGEVDINGNQYPEEVNLRYPKAGTKNPEVKLFLVDIQDPNLELKSIPAPESVTNDHILGAVTWINDDQVGAFWLNRRQNFASFQSCNLNANCFEVSVETMLMATDI